MDKYISNCNRYVFFYKTYYLLLTGFFFVCFLFLEFIDGGTLSDLLLDHSVELSWKQRVAFAKDIAAGMVNFWTYIFFSPDKLY